jgi:hypothetical protein
MAVYNNGARLREPYWRLPEFVTVHVAYGR